MARDERLSERRAASAVAGALRPAHRDAIRRETGQKNVAKVIAKAMIENANADRIIAFWSATGPNLVAALMTVCDASESQASFLVGAAAHATLLGKQDAAPDAILRLAERAACYQAGMVAALTVDEKELL